LAESPEILAEAIAAMDDMERLTAVPTIARCWTASAPNTPKSQGKPPGSIRK